ncbi:MAG: UDP-N-acetylmuramoyl-L-alanine--D-glutamate ligase [Anaerolineae bacterium]
MTSLQLARTWFAGRIVGIVGLGREGLALARFMLPLGARVIATDGKPLEALGGEVHSLLAQGMELHAGGLSDKALEVDQCFVSPGVPIDVPLLAAARQRGVPLWSEPGLFLALCPAPVYGITGSAGKSTTSSMVAAALTASRRRTHLGGNIGRPLIETLAEINSDDAVVMELSSFQLEWVRHSPRYSLITNVTPNHLDRHYTMAAYVEAKAGILRYQTAGDTLVLNAEDEWCRWLAPRGRSRVGWFSDAREVGRGAYLRDGAICTVRDGVVEEVCRADDIRLLGRHNVANALAAAALCSTAGLPSQAIREGIVGFRGLPHRLEPVGVVDGVSYYNDSIATTPERAIAGMRAIQAPLVLLAGGRDKHLPWDTWLEEVRRRVKAVVLFGEAAAMLTELTAELDRPKARVATLAEAVEAARALAAPADAVLLSPGGTSFDEFRDFEERGVRFRELVQSMEGQA